MKHALYLAGLLALCCVAWLCIEASLLVHGARKALPDTAQKLNATLDDLDSTAKVAHDASQKQADWYDPDKKGGATQQIQRTISSFKELAVRTNCNLNGGLECGQPVLPELARTLASTGDLSRQAAITLTDNSKRLEPIIVDLGTGAAAFAQKAPVAMDNLVEMSANGVKISKHTDETLVEFDGTAHDLHSISGNGREMMQKVHDDFMKPANRALLYLKTALGITANLGDAAKL